MIEEYDKNNIFAKIIRGELESNKVYEDEYILAFHDKYPDAPIHVLVIPKKEYISFDDFITNAKGTEIIHFFTKIKEITQSFNIENPHYKIVSNSGSRADQMVYHFHMHVMIYPKQGE